MNGSFLKKLNFFKKLGNVLFSLKLPLFMDTCVREIAYEKNEIKANVREKSLHE